jgi:sterol-4alpha-carboxylate 3-dehydrogenase (decarboxylating)
MTAASLGSVLVVGGCGFVGSHVVSWLMKEPDCSVSVLSRNPNHSRIPGASYYACDVTDLNSLRNLILELQPRVIINTASAVPGQMDRDDESSLYQVNVVGTQNLLEVAKATKSVEAFVQTSTGVVHAATEFCYITEDAPLQDKYSKAVGYEYSKALADKMVLTANGPELRTLCLRPMGIYGERDNTLIPGMLTLLRDKKTNFQIGDNTKPFDSIYVGNVAYAHVLAVKALLVNDASSPKVDGEAFLLSDDEPIPFWDFHRKVWAAAGYQTPLDQVYVIPSWLYMGVACIVEYFFWVFTLGRKLPPQHFRRNLVRFTFGEYTVNIDKAKERLGYKPLVGTDEGIKRAVDWALQNEARWSTLKNKTI